MFRRCWGVTGTSPRMRGKPSVLLAEDPVWRNIPAYAGKTCRPRSRVVRNSEHPRVCGENSYRTTDEPIDTGTSPRMRGKHDYIIQRVDSGRNIPAYAGKTGKPERVLTHQEGTSPRMRGKLRFRMPRLSCNQEHPRVCGENPQMISTA